MHFKGFNPLILHVHVRRESLHNTTSREAMGGMTQHVLFEVVEKVWGKKVSQAAVGFISRYQTYPWMQRATSEVGFCCDKE